MSKTRYIVAWRYKPSRRPSGEPPRQFEAFDTEGEARERFNAVSTFKVGYKVLSYGFGNVLAEMGRGQ